MQRIGPQQRGLGARARRANGRAARRYRATQHQPRWRARVQAPWGPKGNEPLGSLDAMVNIINDLIDRKLIHIEPHDAIVTLKPG